MSNVLFQGTGFTSRLPVSRYRSYLHCYAVQQLYSICFL